MKKTRLKHGKLGYKTFPSGKNQLFQPEGSPVISEDFQKVGATFLLSAAPHIGNKAAAHARHSSCGGTPLLDRNWKME
jgi:hypothetical protein